MGEDKEMGHVFSYKWRGGSKGIEQQQQQQK